MISRDVFESVLKALCDWSSDELDRLFVAASVVNDGVIQYGEVLDWVIASKMPTPPSKS